MVRLSVDTTRMKRLLEKKKLIVYHQDVDGTSAAALLLKFFPSHTMPLESPVIEENDVNAIRHYGADVVVFLDLAVDQDHERVKELEQGMELLIIDHHLFGNDLNSSRTLYINPRLEKRDIYVSASWVVYHLLKMIGKPVKQAAWISGIGIIGDYAFAEGGDVLAEVDEELVAGPPRQSRLAEGGTLISAAITAAGEKGGKAALDALITAETFDAFRSNQNLQAWNDTVEGEIEQEVERFETEREYYPSMGVAIMQLDSELSITSTVATLLSERHPELVIVIRRRDDDSWKLSIRNQSGRFDLNAVMRTACDGIGRGGGHEKAAGGKVTDWNTFKKRLLKQLTELS